MQSTYDRESIDAWAARERDSQFGEYAPPTRPSIEECSLEKLRSAVADLLYAVSSTFQDKPEEAYGYVARAAALLRIESPGVVASSEPDDGQSAAPSAPRGGLAPSQIRKVSSYIDAYLDLAIATTDLASLVELSAFDFSRAFRESFGEPPHTYVRRRRLERAQGMMLRTGSSLGQIAIECGLADQAHLNRLFRRFVGQSPGAWRRARAAPTE